jgi:hypothetical protein
MTMTDNFVALTFATSWRPPSCFFFSTSCPSLPLAHACRRDGAANRRYRKTLHGVLAWVGCGMN